MLIQYNKLKKYYKKELEMTFFKIYLQRKEAKSKDGHIQRISRTG